MKKPLLDQQLVFGRVNISAFSTRAQLQASSSVLLRTVIKEEDEDAFFNRLSLGSAPTPFAMGATQPVVAEGRHIAAAASNNPRQDASISKAPCDTTGAFASFATATSRLLRRVLLRARQVRDRGVMRSEDSAPLDWTGSTAVSDVPCNGGGGAEYTAQLAKFSATAPPSAASTAQQTALHRTRSIKELAFRALSSEDARWATSEAQTHWPSIPVQHDHSSLHPLQRPQQEHVSSKLTQAHHKHHHKHPTRHMRHAANIQSRGAKEEYSRHLVALISDIDVQFALQALQVAAHVHDEVWVHNAAPEVGGGVLSREALLKAASPMYGTAMTAACAIQHRALHSLVKQAVRRYVNPHRGSPDDVLHVILELLTGCGAPAVVSGQPPMLQPVVTTAGFSASPARRSYMHLLSGIHPGIYGRSGRSGRSGSSTIQNATVAERSNAAADSHPR